MDYSQFLHMREELSLVAVLLLLFLADLFMSPDAHKQKGTTPVLNTMLPVILMAIHTAINLVPGTAADIFGGMYHYVPMHTVVKSILNIGTLIVFLMAHEWMKRDDTSFKQGEFYVLILSTLFGMYLMISAGHFLMFFIGLETASIPMAALIAFDKYRHNSAEAGAKYILTALFSSALLLFGLSMIYGSAGTLYFEDLPAHIDGNPLQIMAFVFFFTGMAFKLSLVPFHLWTADVYEGAPSAVTAYLSVISKGSAAFVLMAILIKVFAPMIHDWQEVLYWVTIASITIANIFAIRQQNLKRLMAFSSISQAGYIMLGIIGGFIAPVFKPMGFATWQAAVSLLTGFVAKEAVVSSLCLFYGISSTAGAEAAGILSGTFGTPVAAYAFLVFTLLYVPCVAAFATMKRELGGWKWALGSAAYQIAIAYIMSVLVYTVGMMIL